jgi:hypothetical protein
MATGRSHPSLVIDVQVLVTHAASVATQEREMGTPPRLIRTPDVCYLFHARDEARLPGLVDRWEAYGIAAQVVHIPPRGDRRPATVLLPHDPATHRQAVTPAHPTTGLIRQSDPRRARPPTGETRMSAPTDHGTEGHDQTAPSLTDARGPEGTMDAPPETEASFEEIER